NRKSIFKIPGSRRMGWAAAVGAVVLLGSVTVLKLKDAPDMKTAVSKSMNIALPSQEEDTLPKQRNLILSSTDKKLIASAASAMKEGKLRSAEKSEYKKINKKESGGESSLSLEDWNSTGNDEYDYTEEEERLARSNYRVVRSEEEAEAMLNSIYSRLENNLERETNKISRYELEYESSMVKLSEINNVTLLKEKYHEQTPL
ncbi:MAG: hypothetical protein K2H18_04420, partial [Muribaculaceae bacterium]|nr:hypothetical protein [Muribaculaceae bacterium]